LILQNPLIPLNRDGSTDLRHVQAAKERAVAGLRLMQLREKRREWRCVVDAGMAAALAVIRDRRLAWLASYKLAIASGAGSFETLVMRWSSLRKASILTYRRMEDQMRKLAKVLDDEITKYPVFVTR
jgi:hypothetical protein